jgi:hypothetical protein
VGRLGPAGVLAAVVSLAGTVEAGDAVVPSATLACEERPSKGRVVCEAEVEVADGRLAWADLVVVEAPEFARPLRARVGFTEAVVRTERRVRLPFALLAVRDGEGRVGVRLRVVACQTGRDGELCLPGAVEAETVLRIGPLRSR